MSIRPMRQNEVILLRDRGLQLIGLVAVHIEFILTTQRLIVQPVQWIERTLFGARDSSFELLDIENVTVGGVNQTLQIKVYGQVNHFLGEGAQRIKDRLQPEAVSYSEASEDRTLFHSGINISVTAGLSVPGWLNIHRDKLHIYSQQKLPNRLFSQQDFLASWSDISIKNYSALNRMLSLEFEKQSISFFGREAKLCFHILEAHQNNERLFETIEIVTVTEDSLVGTEGFLFLGLRETHFVPTGRLEEAIGSSWLHQPHEALHKIYIHGWTNTTVSLVFTESEWRIEMPNPNLWVQYYQKSLFLLYHRQPFTLSELPYSEEDIVFSSYSLFKHHKKNDELYFGQLVLTREHLVFYPLNQPHVFKAKLGEILQVEARSFKILILAQSNIVEFQTPDSSMLPKYERRILNCLPPMEVRSARGNQSIDKVLGETKDVILLRDGIPFLNVSSTTVQQSGARLQIFVGRHKKEFDFSIGETLDIDIAKTQGRFRFKSELIREYVSRPDPMGRYYLLVHLPDNIYIYNKRGAFRVPYENDIIVDQIVGYRSSLTDVPFKIHDLSISGCQLSTKIQLDPTQIDDQIQFHFSLELSTQTIDLVGTLLHIQNDHTSERIVFGLQFLDLDRNLQDVLQTEVLEIERELLRQNSESL